MSATTDMIAASKRPYDYIVTEARHLERGRQGSKEAV